MRASPETDSFNLGDLGDSLRFHDPLDIRGTEPARLERWLRGLIEIRCAEEKIGDEFGRSVIKCPCHLAIGQEAVAVGIAEDLKRGDRVFGAHRSHAHFLALGGGLHSLLAEALGKDTGCSRGMGGSMHLRDAENGFYGSVPIVGATVPIATGAALAAKMEGGDAIAVSFLGDGATEEGVFHESLNFAAVFKLPVLYVVENNLFSSHLHISLRQPYNSICRYAEAHGVEWRRIDGNDIVTVAAAGAAAIAAARSGKPQLIEAVTYRWRGHVGHREDNDVGVMRKEGLVDWKNRDPIRRLADAMIASGVLTGSTLGRIWDDSRRDVEAAWARAMTDPYPPREALLARVYSEGRQ